MEMFSDLVKVMNDSELQSKLLELPLAAVLVLLRRCASLSVVLRTLYGCQTRTYAHAHTCTPTNAHGLIHASTYLSLHLPKKGVCMERAQVKMFVQFMVWCSRICNADWKALLSSACAGKRLLDKTKHALMAVHLQSLDC